MPSSPKFFYARQSWLSQSRRTTLSLVCFILGIAGTIFGLIAIFTPLNGYRCRDSVPRSVSVAWVSETDVADRNSGDTASQKRFKVMGFVGIQTGFRSAGRRASLRKTWMPSDNRGLQRLEESTGLAFRFVIGRTNDVSKMLTLRREIATYDDFMLLDIEEEYRNLPHKTLAFFKASYALYDAEFYVKADDDIYLRPDRLSLLLSKERPNRQTYLGCMKKGPVFTDPNLKWYEPLSSLLGKEYFIHAYGPIYALSADAVAGLVALRNNSVRMFSNEDVTIGAWMLAMNVNHEDNRALCHSDCNPSSIAVWDIPKCSGLCNPEEKLLRLHQMDSCSGTSTSVSI
ncbi:probable beta-1,3-galactosyltransferase 14 isoform X2 [Aristolochia californica]|uniref:probable beta-1,3-galactosyltransferase 14 isoform X2 n=1 Tax=Aristolochia californica TaxID=171875 RepID=UPI0035E37C6C